MLLSLRYVTNNTRFYLGVLFELKTFKFLLTSELGQTFSTVMLTSLIPVLLAQGDKTGRLLSLSSIISNLITIFLLPYLIKKTACTSSVNYMFCIRFLLLLSCFILLFFQSALLLVGLHALVILLITLQHVNRNNLLVKFEGGVKSSNLFRFEVGESIVILLAALTLFLVDELTQSTIQRVLGWNIILISTLLLVLFIKTRKRSFKVKFSGDVTAKDIAINTFVIQKTPLPMATKLEFARSNVGFLFQRLLWFIAPLWFVHNERAYDFFEWLLLSGLGTLLAAMLLKFSTSSKKSYYLLFKLCNVLIVISLVIMLFNTSYLTICLAGIVANLAAPIHRSYSRMLAEKNEYHQIPSSELLGQGILVVRIIHLALMLIFPFVLSDKYFGWPIVLSSLAILTLINANDLHSKYKSIFQ
jgi:hypothetical protein